MSPLFWDLQKGKQIGLLLSPKKLSANTKVVPCQIPITWKVFIRINTIIKYANNFRTLSVQLGHQLQAWIVYVKTEIMRKKALILFQKVCLIPVLSAWTLYHVPIVSLATRLVIERDKIDNLDLKLQPSYTSRLGFGLKQDRMQAREQKYSRNYLMWCKGITVLMIFD